MRRILKSVVLSLAAVAVVSHVANAANSLVVRDTTFPASTPACEVGIYLSNDVPIVGIVIPLEIRTVSGGAFPMPIPPATTFTNATFRWGPVVGNRLDHSPLGPAYDNQIDSIWPSAQIVTSRYATVDPGDPCSGPTSNSYGNATAQGDAVSPDGFQHSAVSLGNAGAGELTSLAPGSDELGKPSLRFLFPTGPNQGTFVIDTCCMKPAAHLQFVDENTQPITPQFTKGTITVGVGAVKELQTDVIPKDYSLEQNYPNPFNAGTIIRFAQPVDGHVRMEVFNILGHKVRTLVDEFRSAGLHQTDWDGRSDEGVSVSTGVYFYRIVTDGFSTTRKMVLIK